MQVGRPVDDDRRPVALGEDRRAQRHLAGCAGCARWFAGVTHVNRLARTELADPGPGFSEAQLDELLAQLPSPGAKRVLRQVARVALALVGVVQVALGALPLVVPSLAGIDPHAAMMHGGEMGAGAAGMGGEMMGAGMIPALSRAVSVGSGRRPP